MLSPRLTPILLLVLTALFVRLNAAENRPIDVVILAGQSNAGGRGSLADMPAEYRKAPERVRMDYVCSYGARGDGAGPPEPHVSNAWLPVAAQPKHASTPDEHFGPEIGMAHALAQAMPDRELALVKHGRGATSLAEDWNPGATSGKQLYRALLRQIESAMSRLASEGRRGEIRALVWVQGEADTTQEAWASAYERNLGTFFTVIRRDLGRRELPILVVRTGLGQGDARLKFASVVREAQRRVVAADAHATWVDGDDLSLMDAVHYNAFGQIRLGERVAERLIPLIVDTAKAKKP